MTAPVTVVGVGPGGLAGGGEEALPGATLVVGGARHLARWAPPGIATVELTGDLQPGLAAVAAAAGPVVVLASGDPGFFGIVRALAARFGRERLRVLPAVSSVAAAFAAAGVPWDDAVVASAHGRDPTVAVHACLAHPKVAVLTSPRFSPADLASALVDTGVERTLVVAERLGEPDARLVEVDTVTAAATTWTDPNVVVVLDPRRPLVGPRPVLHPPRAVPSRWALDADAFAHRDGMISKTEVRAAALAELAPATGDLLWDVGAGSGAVGIECARFGAAVIAVDRDPHACALVRKNAAVFDVAVRVVSGAAPAALTDLPDPDAVFVGGGGTDLGAILDVVLARTRRAVVVSLATVERVGPTLAALHDGRWSARARMLQAADVVPLGAGHRLAATNPVFVVVGRRP